MRGKLLLPVGAFLMAWGLGLTILSPGLVAGDSAELVSCAWSLGVAHPPGYPLWVLLARLLAECPLGNLAFRVTLLSLLSWSLAVALLGVGLSRVWGEGRVAPVFGFGLALFVAFGPLALGQAVGPEVYGLHYLLSAALLCSMIESTPTSFLGSCFLLGLGLAHHHTLLLVLPSWALAHRERFRDSLALARGCALSFMGLSLYLLLPLRASLRPFNDWGHPATWERFLSHVLRHQYGGDLGSGGALWGLKDTLVYLSHFFLEGWGLSVLLLVVLFFMARGAMRRHLHWGVALVGTLFVLPWLVRTVPNPENIQVNQVFFPPVMLWASPLLILGLRALWERLPSREGRQAVAILAGLVLVARVGFGLLGGDASGNLAADRMARNMLLNLPRGAVLYSEGDTNTFSLAYLKTVLGLRPDIEVFDRTGGLFEDIYHILDGQYAKQGAPGELVRVEMAREALEADRPRFYSESENAPGRLLAVNGLLFRVSTPAAPLTAPRGLWPRFRVPRVEEGADYLSRETAARFYIFRAANSLRAGMPRGWALEDFRQAARWGHDNHRLINNIGLEYLKAGWKDMAETTFQQVVAIDPTYVLGWYNLAVLAKEMGQMVLVEKYYRRCLELAPTYSPARDGLAVALYRTGRLQEAVLQWEKLLKSDTSYAPAFRNLGMAVYEMDPRQARPLLQEYLRLAPNAPDREGIEKFMEGGR